MSNDNVINFTKAQAKTEELKAELQTELESVLTPKQLKMYNIIAATANFLVDNRDNLDYFVLCAATTPETPDGPSPFHLLRSEISPADFALVSKMIEARLFSYMFE